MAGETNIWKGFAPAVAEVHTLTVADVWANSDTATLTINGKSFTSTMAGITGNTHTAVINTIVASWNASTIPEFEEVTAAWATNMTATLTCDTAGLPFTVSATNVTAGNGTLSAAITTTAEGPAVANTASNWSQGSVPNNTQHIVFQNSDRPCKYYLEAFSGNTFASLTVKQSYTADLGLPRQHGSDYVEYRPTYWKSATTDLYIGEGDGSGSGRIKIELATVNTVCIMYNSGSPVENGIPAVLIKGGTAITARLLKGSVGFAVYEGEAATMGNMYCSHRDNIEGDVDCYCGDGCTLLNIEKTGGTLHIESNAEAVTHTAGEMTIGGTATVSTLAVDGGTIYDRSSGAWTTVTIGSAGTIDRGHDLRDHVWTNTSMYRGAKLLHPLSSITHTNGIDLQRCGPQDVTIQKAAHKTWTETAI